MKVFWFHYNKPESRKRQTPVLSVHYCGQCHMVEELIVNVPTFSHKRSTQPHIVIKGKASSFKLINGKLIID